MEERPNNEKELKAGKSVFRRTLFLMVVCGIVAFIVLAARLYKLQIKDHDKYEELAVDQQTRETIVTANRGTIYDANMKILAASANAEKVFISPKEIKEDNSDVDLIARGLADILDADYDKIIEMTKDVKSEYKVICEKIEQELGDRVRQFKTENKIRGIYIVADTKRYYPYNSLAASVVGFVGRENTGLSGLEAQYDKTLQGTNGRIVTAKNSAGTDMLFTKFEDYYDAQDGYDHVLTIDSTVQYYLEKNIESAIADYQILDGGLGIVMDVNTGAILGMANMPGFDPNNYQEISEEAKARLEGLEGEEYSASLSAEQFKQWRNRAISDTYEPGSTFKIITLSIGLEEGVISENDNFYCAGALTNIKGRREPLYCWKHEGHGDQTLAQAAQHSCNCAFVNIGLKIGASKFYDYVEAFGFFDKTGIDIAGETTGLWWSDSVFEDPTNYSQLASAAFGQTFTITPLQLIRAVSCVANGGYLMEPYIVQRIQDKNGNVIEEHTPTVVRQVISEETSDRVCAILETVVGTSEGTGKNAYVAGYRIAGKTGTSTNTVIEAQTNVKQYKVSFIGFAPADDPKVAVLVVLDNPSKSSGIYISGGVMAAPTVGNIFADILPYLDIATIYTDEELAFKDVSVPQVRGKAVDDAKAELEALGFSVKVVGSGYNVTDQTPAASAIIANGSQIVLYAGESKQTDEVVMPSLNGLTVSQARSRLQEYGLFMSTSGVSDNSSTIIATRQSVPAGEKIVRGSVVDVTFRDYNSSIMETG